MMVYSVTYVPIALLNKKCDNIIITTPKNPNKIANNLLIPKYSLRIIGASNVMKIDINWKRTVATLIFKCFKAKNQKLKLNNPVIILARSVFFWLILNKFFPL